MAKSKNTIESRIDYSILLPVLILLLVGMVSIFIATNFDYPKNLVHVMSLEGHALALYFWLGTYGFASYFLFTFFGCLDRSKKLGQYWISHPFSTIRIYEDILHPFSFENRCSG